MTLLGRELKVSVSDNLTTKVFDQRFLISAAVDKSLETSVPDTANVEIVNLNKASRDFLGAENLTVSIEAGYAGKTSVLFLGDLQTVTHEHNGPDWITYLQSGDGAKALQTGFMNKTYEAGAKLEQALGDAAGSLGLELEIIGDNPTFKDTALLRGKSYTLDSKEHLAQISKQHKLNWSVQEGKLVIGKVGEHRSGLITELNYQSGLLFSPTVELDDKTKRINLKATALLQAGLHPGDKVSITSEALNGKVGNTQISKDGTGSVEINIKRILFNANSREGAFVCDIEGAVI